MSIELMKAVRTFISAEAVKFHESDYNEMTEDEKAKFAEANQEVSKICSQLKNSLTKEQWQLIMDLKSAETFKNIIIHDHMFTMGVIKGITDFKYLKKILDESDNSLENNW